MKRQRLVLNNALLIALVAMGAYFASKSAAFLTGGNFANIGTNSAILAVVAVAATGLLIAGYVDLSVGSVVGLSGTLASMAVVQWHWSPWLAMLFGIAIGAGIGAINGASSHESKPNVEWEIAVFGTGGQLQLDSVTADVHFGSADGNIYRADLPPNAGVYEPTGPLRTLISVAQGGLAGDESPAELGARTVELVEASFRSARSGRAESVPSPARPACEGAMPAGPGRGR